MQIACPACGKNNDLASELACSRCGCDLECLAETLTAAAAHLRVAIGALHRGEWAEARRQAEKSWLLRHNSRSARLAALAAMRLGHREEFLRWRDRGNGVGLKDE